ncbi:MAG TPA: pyridoxamine 5'-phosphate oxidase family protein [Patescibacteria group bacterium]|jgi:uncharacterized protein YhbP (UPF0306 family)|nr:pyridoxamine 5'-phosphate oxidase family protein [Patescibacteria group bacterium]
MDDKIAGLIKQYLSQGKVMQIATQNGSQPWICAVYYVTDGSQNLYWLSLPTARHSQEIANNTKLAIAIAIKLDQPVIGLQAEGVGSTVTEASIIADIMQLYTKRHNTGKDFYNNFMSGKNQHLLYKFTPKYFQLFDEVQFAKNDIQTWSIQD